MEQMSPIDPSLRFGLSDREIRRGYARARSERALALLAALHEEQVRLDAALDDAVAYARGAQVTWEQIGAELLMSGQAARERWRRLERNHRQASMI